MPRRGATSPKSSTRSIVDTEIWVGDASVPVGRLVYAKDGPREFSQFAYSQTWLEHPRVFSISPDLPLMLGHQLRKPPSDQDSCFFFALADTEPDTWGRQVIARARARQRQTESSLGPLTELDYLCAVDDFSRVGALRLRDPQQRYLESAEDGRRATPPLVDMSRVLAASRALELNQESDEDLRYLLGKGTSLGGARPKSTVLDTDGSLALGKFPSVTDQRSITRGEVLALTLADMAGIDTAMARIEIVHESPVAIIRRFDRTVTGGRIPYMSGATILQAERGDSATYVDLVDAMRMSSADFQADARALWGRLLFNLLITNVDDHLHNIGFLYVGNQQWSLSPAFDLNPFPDKQRESKTMLSEDTGPITSVKLLLEAARRFELTRAQARTTLQRVVASLVRWQEVAQSPEVGLTETELLAFRDAFEHNELDAAKAALG
jgi:serine/threonine-protein kinase HipA